MGAENRLRFTTQQYKDKHKAKAKHPDVTPPPLPPELLNRVAGEPQHDEVKALKAELASLKAAHENLKANFRFATGHSVDQNGDIEPVTTRKA